jgi:hypothetical protein
VVLADTTDADLTDVKEIQLLDVALRIMTDCRIDSPAAMNALVKIPHSVHHTRWSTVARRTIGTVWPGSSDPNGKRIKFNLWDSVRSVIQSTTPADAQAILDEVVAVELAHSVSEKKEEGVGGGAKNC